MLFKRLRYAPSFDHVDQFRSEFDNLFRRLSSHTARDFGANVYPAVNIAQDTDNFYLRAEVPGVKSEDLDISVVRNKVTLSVKRQQTTEEPRNYHRRERNFGEFKRTVTLSNDIDPEKVVANYKNGVLTVKLAKTEAAKPRQIEIKTA